MTAHADALDAKANYLLVAETFTAGLAGVALQSTHITNWARLICLAGICSLAYAGVQAWKMLHPENYDAEDAIALALWRDEILQKNPGLAPEEIEDLFCDGLARGAVERIQ